MRILQFATLIAALCGLSACERPDAPPTDSIPDRGAYLVDAGGRVVERIEAGGSLQLGLNGVEPGRQYEFVLTLDGDLVSYSRLTAGAEGAIDPFHLWFHTGVVGCAERVPEELGRFQFRSFEEAEQAFAGRELSLEIREAAQAGRERETTAARERTGDGIVQRMTIPVAGRQSPTVYPSNAEGCLINSLETGTGDMFVSGRGFEPGQSVEISIVPNQRRWRVGDRVTDRTGLSGAHAPVIAQADEAGRFTVNAWRGERQLRGAYDIVARPLEPGDEGFGPGAPLRDIDLAPFGSDTGFLLFLYYPPGSGQMDIAGRPLAGSPYFEFSDAFVRTGDPVWGAVDPTYVPAGHTGGDYAAYYVVDHRNAMTWMSDTSLTDVSGGPEITRVKAGCVNGTDIVIWPSPLNDGQYDVVVNFGSVAAGTPGAFADDFTYDLATDFLDGAVQVGFHVGQDSYSMCPMAVGQAEYDFVDALWLSNRVNQHTGTPNGTATVDLRAVVRYPATAAGTNTPVAPGAHPVFIMEHGNHQHCETGGPVSHAACTNRTPNHEGYMNLLDTLASHGIIAVSIDAYDLTGWVPQWIEERGDLILKHLEFWSHLDDSSTYPSYSDPFGGLFAGHVDMSAISVSGHSRGGEASVAAWARNQSRPPAQQFAIGSVSSIAPVDALAGPAYTLNGVPYFVILPAADGDVSNLQGARIYDRAGSGTDLMKSGVHIYGANHNFFNTVWASDGDDSDPGRVDYIAAPDQQRIGESLLAAFARQHLNNDDFYANLFRGDLRFPSLSGLKIYYFHHQPPNSPLETGSGSGTASGAITVSSISGPSVHETQAVRTNWTGSSARYEYAIAGGMDVTGFEVISLRAAQTGHASNPAGDQQFAIELSDGSNNRAVYTGRFDPIPDQYDHPYFASDHSVMTTVRIPLHSFIMNNSGLDLTDIRSVELQFIHPSQGEIYIDDIEFSR